MEVSGSKVSGFKDSLSIGSTEDFDVDCDPCKFLSKTVEARKFCVNCKENLCIHCVNCHKSTTASRHHYILDQPQKEAGGTTAAFDDSKTCTEYCKSHKKEVIKFFCSQHDRVGCSDCMTLEHRACNIDYIPDVCSGILNSKEFSGTLHTVSKTLNEVELTEQQAQSKKAENKSSVEGVIKQIKKFQKKMNDRIEQFKEQLITEANSHKLNQDQEINKISDSCARVYSELKQIHTDLRDCQTKQLDAQAFVTLKQAQLILSSTHVQAYEQDLTNVSTCISFEPNSELENLISEPSGLGKISLSLAYYVKEDKTRTTLHSIRQHSSINVRTKSDMFNCLIRGCAVVSADKLLLSDWNNMKLKIVCTKTYSPIEEINLDSKPCDITVLPQDQVAVTMPLKQEIQIVGTLGKLTLIRSIHVDRECLGIDCYQDRIYVVCQAHNSLLVLDMSGSIQRDISLQTAQDHMFERPVYVAISKDGQTLNISDWQSVASLTLQGKVISVYKHDEVDDLRGLVMLDDGSLLACCKASGTILHISADLRKAGVLTENVLDARSICCNPVNRHIYVGALDQCSIFSYE